ncbi:hypothetical protein [Nonomuraea sp. NPDC003804]|uniref:hypothetical protein n=1 Tax=Nonomuraea sp. NPDC003804 TaxID=3154547 RepID=UPI0033AC6AF3
MSEPPQLDADLSQHTVAATTFRDIGADFVAAVNHAVRELEELGNWPIEEESDRKFAEWYAPKRVEMMKLLGQFGLAYGDVGDKLAIMRDNVAVADWASADDMTVQDVPAYELPDLQGFMPKGPMP